MLVLTRKCQEAILIGGDADLSPLLKIVILRINNGKVRLGFESVAGLLVHRLEVWNLIQSKRIADIPGQSPVD